MTRSFNTYLIMFLVIALVFSAGCSSVNEDREKIAYIKVNADSKYGDTFKELNIGLISDFNLKLPYADKSWVNIWVEGYSNGKAVEPFPLTTLSYGLSPRQIEEGPMGFGILNPNSQEPLFFLYGPNVRTNPHNIENNIIYQSGISTWGNAIGDETIALEPGEEKILAVYRQGKNSLRTYDYQDPEAIEQMIKEDMTVLLLKIKVEEKTEI